MATVSNPATLSSIIAAFGGPSNLRSYLRGGSYVHNVVNAYPNIVTTGTILLSNYAGVIAPPSSFTFSTNSAAGASVGGTATATLTMYANGAIRGTNTSLWLAAGNSPDFDVYMEKSSGTTDCTNQNTWLNMVSNRSFSISRSTTGSYTWGGTLYLRVSNTPQTTLNAIPITMSVNRQPPDQCPTCCFTPDTLILMASGVWTAIVDVQVGDEIATRTGSKEVTEVITRTNRVMYEIRFMDGRILNASEDHPLYVVDKGYAAINPGVGGAYKDLGIPDQLYVGDLVLDSEGRENQIVEITEIDYPHTVYTFMESEFYANGMLVY